MSDQHPDPYDRTRRMDGADAPSPADPTRPLGGRAPGEVGTRRMPAAGPGRPVAAQERTQAMPAAARAAQPIAYTEDYAADRAAADRAAADRTAVDDGRKVPFDQPADRLPSAAEGEGRRTFTPTALALSIVAALLVGAILTLLLLPEEEPQVVLADQQAQVALTEAQTANAEQATRITQLEASIAELEGLVAQRDQTIADLQAQIAAGGDQAAADQAAAQAAADQQAAMDARDQALTDREVAIDARDAQVAAREATVTAAEQGTGGGGFELPDVPGLEIPTDLPGELPQIDEDQARGIIERFVDRISSFLG